MTAPSRQLTGSHQTHRQQVLSAISDKHYALNSKIDHSGVLAASFRDRMKKHADDMPEDTGSRLQWLQQQLSNKGL